MALIKCSECGKEVSDKAKSCPKCGNPISIDTTVKVEFQKAGGIFGQGCIVYDDMDRVLARCKSGEVAEFSLKEPTEIKCTIKSCLGSAKILAEPGGRYKVNIRTLGTLAISKVDVIN